VHKRGEEAVHGKYSLVAIKLFPVFLVTLLISGTFLVKFEEPVAQKPRTDTSVDSSCERSVTRVVVVKTKTDLCLERVWSTSDVQRGLSSRRRMKDGPKGDSVQGMLFDAPSNNPGIWMKDMLMPIDIVWLDEDGKILGIERAAQPSSYPKVYGESLIATRYVIELSENDVSRLKLSIGDVMSIPVRATIEP
jgi:uncharacterized membrane protein (UPF0127 family)